MRKISICIPCYNEKQNLIPLYNKLVKETEKLKNYKFEYIFSDNASTDRSEEILKSLAKTDSRVKVIINTKNWGPNRNCSNAIFHATGDAVITFPADLQTPICLVKRYIEAWENGSPVVMGVIDNSQESRLMFSVRSLYYKIIDTFSPFPVLPHVSGGGLFSKKVVDIIKNLDEPDPDFGLLISELGFSYKLVSYTQEKRKHGHSSYNLYRYLDQAINSFTETSGNILRLITLVGSFSIIICVIIFISIFVYKCFYWESFSAFSYLIANGLFLFGSVQLFFIGIIGEYLNLVIKRVKKRPLAVIRETVNFDMVQESDTDIEEGFYIHDQNDH